MTKTRQIEQMLIAKGFNILDVKWHYGRKYLCVISGLDENIVNIARAVVSYGIYSYHSTEKMDKFNIIKFK